MTQLFPFTTEDLIACVEREITMRKKVYPRWVEQRKMKADKADWEIAAMEEIARVLRARAQHGLRTCDELIGQGPERCSLLSGHEGDHEP